jgi:hypothetical protein
MAESLRSPGLDDNNFDHADSLLLTPQERESLVIAELELISAIDNLLVTSPWTDYERKLSSIDNPIRHYARNRETKFLKERSVEFQVNAGSHLREWDSDILIDSDSGIIQQDYSIQETELAKCEQLSSDPGEIFARNIQITITQKPIAPTREPREITDEEMIRLRDVSSFVGVTPWHPKQEITDLAYEILIEPNSIIKRLALTTGETTIDYIPKFKMSNPNLVLSITKQLRELLTFKV